MIEPHPEIRESIIRDASLVEDPTAEDASAKILFDDTGNPILDDKGRMIHVDQ